MPAVSGLNLFGRRARSIIVFVRVCLTPNNVHGLLGRRCPTRHNATNSHGAVISW